MSEDTRRTFLKTVGLAVGATGIAGATETKFGVLADDNTPSTPPLTGENWSTFQYDSANTGHSPSSAPSEYPFVEWSKKIGETGPAFSPPNIVDGTGYTVNTNGTLTAFDLGTQEIDWQVSLQSSLSQDFEQHTHNLSPTVTGDVVLASVHGVLHARNISDGSVKWTKTFDNADTTQDWHLSSTTVVDRTVYVSAQDDGLYALDLADGSERWTVDASEQTYTPAVADGIVYFSGGNTIYALDAEDGTKQWHKTYESGPNAALTVADGRVYANNGESVFALDANDGTQLWYQGGYDYFGGSSAYADGKLFFVMQSGGTVALDGTTGTELWQSTEIGRMTSSLSVANGVVYIISDVGASSPGVFGLDAKTGDVLWRYERREVTYSSETSYPSPTIADGTLYVADRMGYVYALGTKAPDDLNWRSEIVGDYRDKDLAEGIMSPATGDGAIYSITGGSIVAIGEESGTKRWQFNPDAGVVHAPVFGSGTVFAASRYELYALDGQDGTVQWKRSLEDEIDAVTATEDGTVYVAGSSKFFALDADTGEQEWVAPDGQCSVLRSPATTLVVTDDDVFYASYDHLYAIDRIDGTVRWSVYDKHMQTDPVHTSLAVENGTVYMGITNREHEGPDNLLAFDVEDGSKRWSTRVTDMPVNGIVAHGDSLYMTFGNEDAETLLLIELSADDGTERWRFTASNDGRGLVTDPVVVGDTVYFAANRRVHVLDNNGNRTGRWEISGSVGASPVVTDDALYVPSSDLRYEDLAFVYSFNRDE